MTLACLRKGETFADLAAGFGVSTATARRYVNETVALLAARAPKLRPALRAASKAGHCHLILDGTLIPIDRAAADRPFYSGKHKKHGMNLQVITSPAGDLLWVSGPLPGHVHDLKAARIWGVPRELAFTGLLTLADKGYHGAGDLHDHPVLRAGTSRPHRKHQTATAPSSGPPASAATPSSRTGASCASSAAAPGAPDTSPKAIHVPQIRETQR